MKKQKENLIFKPMALMLALSLIFFFGNSVDFLQAEDAPDNPPPSTEEAEENKKCATTFYKFTDEQLKAYGDWIERHFQNKSSTTTLLDDAITRYKELRITLLNESYTYVPQAFQPLLSEGFEGPECRQLVEDTLKKARQLLQTKSTLTSTVKKTTILLNKYQELNGKLAKLNRDFMTMRKYLDTFASKLPCYVNRSCNKG